MSSEWRLTVAELEGATGGLVRSLVADAFSRVGTDSRKDLTGQLFVPLKGDRFDGHDFLPQAVNNGASVALIHEFREEWRELQSKVTLVQVKDTLQALQALARFWRQKNKYTVLGITGSNGKTTTKEFTHTLLSAHFRTHASKGSLNNHWGVPISILEANANHTHLVLEMGMNHLGEIWRLCQISEPDVVVVTTVGRAHIGELGSQAAVAQAKEEIYVAAPKATHVFNVDNEWTMRMETRSQARKLRFSGFRENVDVHLRAQRINWNGLDVIGHIGGVKGQAQVGVLGRHNVVNLMAASSLALALGLSPEIIWQGLGKIKDIAWGRNQVLRLTNGATVFFDAYNANPDSMLALVKNIYEFELPGRKFMILGDMAEQGEFTVSGHEELGQRVADLQCESVWFVGQNADHFWRGFDKTHKTTLKFSSASVDTDIAAKFLELLKPGDLVALKGSRSVGLEKVLQKWPLATPMGSKE